LRLLERFSTCYIMGRVVVSFLRACRQSSHFVDGEVP
jgi:hypothetical protein